VPKACSLMGRDQWQAPLLTTHRGQGADWSGCRTGVSLLAMRRFPAPNSCQAIMANYLLQQLYLFLLRDNVTDRYRLLSPCHSCWISLLSMWHRVFVFSVSVPTTVESILMICHKISIWDWIRAKSRRFLERPTHCIIHNHWSFSVINQV
jgi:hypothetical protein